MNVKGIIKQIADVKKVYENPNPIDLWLSWYKGKTLWHNYKVYNGQNHISLQRYSLQMAKKICEDWANLLINEKTDIVVGDETATTIIEKIFEDTKFWRKANGGIEKTFALSMGAFVLSVDNLTADEESGEIVDTSTAKININFINATKIVPITIVNGEVTECAFVTKDTNKTYISIHLLRNGVYEIHNIEAKGTGDNISFEKDNDYYIFDTMSNKPWFFMFKPNLVNNIDIDCPLGISVFANSIDLLKETDIIFDGYSNEFLLGRKRTYVSTSLMKIDPTTGEQVRVFDPNDTVVYVLPEDQDGKSSITTASDTLRIAEHNQGMQQVLNMLSANVGFGTNHYKYDSGSLATATQVISENSDMFRTIKKHEIIIEEVIINMVKSIIYISNNFTSNPVIDEDVDISVSFDDSIIEDKQGEKAQDRLDVQMGAMTLVEYRMKWYGEDENTAEAAVSNMSKFTLDEPEEEPIEGVV